MKDLSVLIKPASSLCNMRCRYCFYADVSDKREIRSYGIMQPETTEKVIDALFADADDNAHISIAFQGGEPTLAGICYFRHLIAYVEEHQKKKAVSVDYSIQTNGYLINEEWCELFRKHRFLVGISLDGPSEYHNRNRLDAAGKGTYQRLMSAIKCLRQYGIEFNILCVLTKDNARHPEKLWNFFLEQRLDYIQFIPCLPELDEEDNTYSLTPQLFHDFYLSLFRLWLEQVKKRNYISIKLFDDIANMLVYSRLTGCGLNGSCNLQCIVEADGSVYPCDFYVLDEYRLGNLTADPMPAIRKAYKDSSFHELRRELPKVCQNCKFTKLCHGGCVRLRQSMYLQGDYCGYKKLLEEIGRPLMQAAQFLAGL